MGSKFILVADDETLFRQVTAAAIEDAGFRVGDVEDGRAAVRSLDAEAPDLSSPVTFPYASQASGMWGSWGTCGTGGRQPRTSRLT